MKQRNSSLFVALALLAVVSLAGSSSAFATDTALDAGSEAANAAQPAQTNAEAAKLTSGSYDVKPEDEKIAEGYTAYKINGKYVIEKSFTASTKDKVIAVGRSTTVDVTPSTFASEVKLKSSDEKIAKIENGAIIGVSSGMVDITVSTPYTEDEKVSVLVYSIAAAEDLSPEAAESIIASVSGSIAQYYATPDSTTAIGRQYAQIINSIKEGHNFQISMTVSSNPSISSEEISLILKETAGTNLASIYDISVMLKDLTDDSLSVSLDTLSSPTSAFIPIPAEFVDQLKTRNISVMNLHKDLDSGEYAFNKIESVTFDDKDNLVFSTNKFSVYTVTYDGAPIQAETKTVSAPNTAGYGTDLSVFHIVAMAGTGIVGLALAGYSAKRAYLRHKISMK